jgi:hypothetical protein
MCDNASRGIKVREGKGRERNWKVLPVGFKMEEKVKGKESR